MYIGHTLATVPAAMWTLFGSLAACLGAAGVTHLAETTAGARSLRVPGLVELGLAVVMVLLAIGLGAAR